MINAEVILTDRGEQVFEHRFSRDYFENGKGVIYGDQFSLRNPLNNGSDISFMFSTVSGVGVGVTEYLTGVEQVGIDNALRRIYVEPNRVESIGQEYGRVLLIVAAPPRPLPLLENLE